MMKTRLVCSLALLCFGPAAALFAQSVQGVSAEGLVDTVKTGCKTEITSYCKDVTQGGGHVLACLYAHEDKLSARCEYALYDASSELDRAVSALSYLRAECDEDLEKHCSNVEPGQGRL